MKRKILISIIIIIFVLILSQIVYAILVPDRPYGRDWEPIFNCANSEWISEDGRVTLFVDDDYQITGTVVNDNEILEIEVRSFHSCLFIFEYIPDSEEYHMHGNKYEEWIVKRSNSDRMIVKVSYIEDGSKVTFYRVDNTSQTE